MIQKLRRKIKRAVFGYTESGPTMSEKQGKILDAGKLQSTVSSTKQITV